jgi:hypothetical protein
MKTAAGIRLEGHAILPCAEHIVHGIRVDGASPTTRRAASELRVLGIADATNGVNLERVSRILLLNVGMPV